MPYQDTLQTVILANNFFTKDECERIIDLGNSLHKENATINQDNKDVENAIRKNKIAWIEPKLKGFEFAYNKLSQIIDIANTQNYKFDLDGFDEDIQFTEYSQLHDRYGKHLDIIFNGIVRKLSVVIQLSDPNDYEGCELHVFDQEKPIVCPRSQGTVIMFPSFMLHEVTPLIKGTRYSLVSWVNGKPFK